MQKALRECEWHRGNEARESLENKMAAVDCFLEDTNQIVITWNFKFYFGANGTILQQLVNIDTHPKIKKKPINMHYYFDCNKMFIIKPVGFYFLLNSFRPFI
jgi:hypothetical protein